MIVYLLFFHYFTLSILYFTLVKKKQIIIKSKSISIHQPNYFPWLGYFYKIWVSDIFVFLDDAQYSKQGYTSSVSVRSVSDNIEKFKLTVPVRKSSITTAINEVEIHGDFWIKKHWRYITSTYGKAPFFEENYIFIKGLYSDFLGENSLSELNKHIVLELCKYFDFDTIMLDSSKMAVRGRSTDRIVNIIKETDADIYFSGMGSSKYLEDEILLAHGISIAKNDFYHYLNDNPYICEDFDFVNGLSILDALFVVGKNGIIDLFKEYTI